MSQMFSSDMVLQHTNPTIVGTCNDPLSSVADLISEVAVIVMDAAAQKILETIQKPIDSSGHFTVVLSSRKPSPIFYKIIVKCPSGAKANASRVLYGSIIVCGGQSNMGFPTKSEYNATKELEVDTTANYPLVKLFGLKSANASMPLQELVPRWRTGWANLSRQQPTPNLNAAPVAQMSAVCWNAGKELIRRFRSRGEQHPLGLVDASLGSTRIECWLPSKALATCSAEYAAFPDVQVVVG